MLKNWQEKEPGSGAGRWAEAVYEGRPSAVPAAPGDLIGRVRGAWLDRQRPADRIRL